MEQDLKDTQEEEDYEDAATTARRRPKRWAWSPSEAYFTDILIRTCVEVLECGRHMALAGIQQVIMDIWHRRYFNVVLHPKPHLLQHPSEVWKHTAFTDQREYDATAIDFGETHCFSARQWHEAAVSRLCGKNLEQVQARKTGNWKSNSSDFC